MCFIFKTNKRRVSYLWPLKNPIPVAISIPVAGCCLKYRSPIRTRVPWKTNTKKWWSPSRSGTGNGQEQPSSLAVRWHWSLWRLPGKYSKDSAISEERLPPARDGTLFFKAPINVKLRHSEALQCLTPRVHNGTKKRSRGSSSECLRFWKQK